MNSFDFVESIVTNALVRSSSTDPCAHHQKQQEPLSRPGSSNVKSRRAVGAWRPASAESVNSTVSTLPASRTERPHAVLGSDQQKEGRKHLLIPRHMLEPIPLASTDAQSAELLHAPDAVSPESAVLFAQCNRLVADLPACIARLAKEDTIASRNMLQLLWISLVSCLKPSSNAADEQRRLLAELTSPQLLLQLTTAADGSYVDVARRSALGSTIAVERVQAAPDVLAIEVAAAKEALDKAVKDHHAACLFAQDFLCHQGQEEKGAKLTLPPTDSATPVRASENHQDDVCTTSTAIQLNDEQCSSLLHSARQQWMAQLSYAKALERKAIAHFVQNTVATKALAGIALDSTNSGREYDGKKVLETLRQRAAEISATVRLLQRRPMDTKSSPSTSANEVQLTQLLLERDAIRLAANVVENCVKEQRKLLDRLEADRRAFAQSRLAEEHTRKALQDESMYRAQTDATLRKRVTALEEELKLSQSMLSREQATSEALRRHIAALRAGSHLATDAHGSSHPSLSPIRQQQDRPGSASALSIMTHQQSRGRLTSIEQSQLASRLGESHRSGIVPCDASTSSPPLRCQRCQSRSDVRDNDHLHNHQSTPQRTSSPVPLSELNEKLYYSRKDLRMLSSQKLLSAILNESEEKQVGKKKKANFSRDEVEQIVHRLYVKQIQDKESLREKLFDEHVVSKETQMPRRAADEIDGIVSRLAKGKE